MLRRYCSSFETNILTLITKLFKFLSNGLRLELDGVIALEHWSLSVGNIVSNLVVWRLGYLLCGPGT